MAENNLPVGPPWLWQHVLEHDPECTDIFTTTHVCVDCAPFLEPYQPDPIDSGILPETEYVKCKETGPPKNLDLYNYTLMDSMWVSPDFMKECNFWDSNMSEEAIRCAIAYASEILFGLTGRQFKGICERVLSPGCFMSKKWTHSCGGKCFIGKSGNCNYPKSVDVGCTGDELRLPGPIQAIAEIVINGEVLDPNSYVISGNKVIRVDGKQWPKSNNITRSPYQVYPEKTIEGNPAVESPWIQELKDTHNIVERSDRKRQELAGWVGADRQEDWVVNFLASYPNLISDSQVLKNHKQDWVSEWLEEKGITFTKVSSLKQGLGETNYLLTPKENRALISELSDGCNDCSSSINLGKSCRSCGSCDLAIYTPKATSDIPEWASEWALANRFEIAEPSSGLDKKCIKSLTNLMHSCDDNCGNQIVELIRYPEKLDIDLSYLNYSTYVATGMFFPESHIPNSLKNYVEVMAPAFSMCGTEQEFNMVLEYTKRDRLDSLNQSDNFGLDSINFEGSDAPGWATQALGLKSKVNKETKYKVTIPDDANMADWARKHLSNEKNLQVKEYFAEWINKNLDYDVEVEKEEVYKASESKSVRIGELDKLTPNTKPVDANDTAWVVRYYQGTGIPHSARVAAAILARDIAGALCSAGGCFTPRSLARLDIDDAASFRWPDLMSSLKLGKTGIPEIDMFIHSVNPHGLTETAYGLDPCKRPDRTHQNIRRNSGINRKKPF